MYQEYEKSRCIWRRNRIVLPALRIKDVSDGSYTKSGIQNRLVPAYNELCGKKWGLVGCGGIGSAVARVAEAFGCEVCVCKKTPHNSYVNMDIDTLMRECDIISVHTPLNDETRNLINKDFHNYLLFGLTDIEIFRVFAQYKESYGTNPNGTVEALNSMHGVGGATHQRHVYLLATEIAPHVIQGLV